MGVTVTHATPSAPTWPGNGVAGLPGDQGRGLLDAFLKRWRDPQFAAKLQEMGAFGRPRRPSVGGWVLIYDVLDADAAHLRQADDTDHKDGLL